MVRWVYGAGTLALTDKDEQKIANEFGKTRPSGLVPPLLG